MLFCYSSFNHSSYFYDTKQKVISLGKKSCDLSYLHIYRETICCLATLQLYIFMSVYYNTIKQPVDFFSSNLSR